MLRFHRTTRIPARLRAAFVALVATPALAACSSTTVTEQEQRIERRVVDIQGEGRSYLAWEPEGVRAEGAPVLLVFHGAGGSGEGMLVGTDVGRVAQALGAVVAFPDADHQNWAEDCRCINADVVHGVADTAFVSTLLADLGAAWGADASTAWVVGFSQGGMFAQRLACQMSDRFRGVAVVAASMSVSLAERCDPARPLDLFITLPTTDPIFPWEGLDDGGFSTLGGLETATLWQGLYGCDATPDEQSESGGTRYVYRDCSEGARLELLGVEPGAHAWFMSSRVDTSDELARFFAG